VNWRCWWGPSQVRWSEVVHADDRRLNACPSVARGSQPCDQEPLDYGLRVVYNLIRPERLRRYRPCRKAKDEIKNIAATSFREWFISPARPILQSQGSRYDVRCDALLGPADTSKRAEKCCLLFGATGEILLQQKTKKQRDSSLRRLHSE
jgi:hypothetical protein